MNRSRRALCLAAKLLRWSVLLLLAFAPPAWSAITLVGSTSAVRSNNLNNPLTLAYPAGVAADDVLIARIAVRGNPGITAPSGWTLVNLTSNGTSLTQVVYRKRASASNPAADDWTFSASGRAGGTIVAYRDVDPIAPVNVYSVRTDTGSVTADSVTPTVAGTQLVGLYSLANGNASFTSPAGMTELEDQNASGGPQGVAIELTDEAYAGGITATGTRVATSSASADSIAHLLALQPSTLASYRMDEAAWTGASGQVLDSSGRSHHATALNGAMIGGTTPAIPDTPGTCNYGMFDGTNDYVAVPASFPNLTTDFTLTAWIRTTNNAKGGQRIFIDDQTNSGGYGFSLGDGGAGRLRFYTRAVTPIILDTPNVIQSNTWYFVAAVADIVAKTKSIHVYNQAGTQLAFVTQTYTGTWGTDAGAVSIGGENNASGESGSNFKFSGNLDEVSVFSGALSAAKLSLVMSQTRPCGGGVPPVAPSGFNAFETGTAAGSVSGVIKTKIAASAFSLAVVALKSSGTAVETAFFGDVKLELVDASAGASCGAYGLIGNLGTLTFVAADQGRKTLAGISEPNAWPNARIRMTYPATGVPVITACSTDNFAIRPGIFSGVGVFDWDWQTAYTSAGAPRTLNNLVKSGGVVHKAGQPFTLIAATVPATATNYTGMPSAVLSTCVGTGCTTVFGTFNVGSAAISGVINSTTASYSEVGAFTLQLQDQTFASVDASDTDGDCSVTGRYVCSAAVNVGRFVPDHFELTPLIMPEPKFKTFNDTTCLTRSFTYVGQPFGYLTLPEATITAKNAAGATTINYSGTLWKLAASDATQTYADADVSRTLDTGLVVTPVLTETGSGVGTLKANAADVVAYVRTTPVAPFMSAITLSMSVRDSTENGEPGNGIIDTVTPAQFSNIAFDVVSGNEFRFGQLVLSNAHGSELLNLPVPIETRFWNGGGFARNAADSCTRLVAANVQLSSWQRDLNACETSVLLPAPPARFIEGRGNLRFSAPGAGNTGSVDLTLQLGATASGGSCAAGSATPAVAALQSWLQGRWTGGDYDQNPAARASFGLNRGSKSLIYLREMY